MKIDRLVSIIMILLEREKISATQLAKMFEVTTRTIYRDIESIELAGIPIITYPGVYGGISIMESYKTKKNLFTPSDVSSLLMGLENIPSSLSNESFTTTLAKVRSLVPEDQLKFVEFKTNQISIDFNSWAEGSNLQSNLEKIKIAFSEVCLVKFEYRARNQELTKRIVEPYRLVLKDGNWYMQGFCLERHDFRTFKLSRILSISVLEKAFKPRDFKPLPMDGSNWIVPKLFPIKLKVHHSLRERIIDRCGFESIENEESGYLFVNFPFVNDEKGYDILFSFNDKCEILEPSYVREEMKLRIQNLVNIYNE